MRLKPYLREGDPAPRCYAEDHVVIGMGRLPSLVVREGRMQILRKEPRHGGASQ
jgi:hypothetical protein